MLAVTSTPSQRRRATLSADASTWNAFPVEVIRLLHQTPTDMQTFVVVGLRWLSWVTALLPRGDRCQLVVRSSE
jgi:hypothetical protein